MIKDWKQAVFIKSCQEYITLVIFLSKQNVHLTECVGVHL